MRSRFTRAQLAAALSIALAIACVDSTGSLGLPTSIQLRSDPGDSVGAGKTYSYTQANALIGADVSGTPTTLTVSVEGDVLWVGFFSMPSGVAKLATGTYTDGFNWHGGTPNGIGYHACRTVTGSFTIDRVRYDSTTLAAADLSFLQHCDGNPAALHGTVHYVRR